MEGQRESDREHGRGSEKKDEKNDEIPAKFENMQRLELNNKELLKNNILIKIEFWDVGEMIKQYGIMIK